MNFKEIYVENWNVLDKEEAKRLKGVVCSEALIEHCVEYEYVKCAYIARRDEAKKLFDMGFDKGITVCPYMFFC